MKTITWTNPDTGRMYTLPTNVNIGGRWYVYEVDSVRPPKTGEYYLSGSIVECYKAIYNYSIPHIVVTVNWQSVKRSKKRSYTMLAHTGKMPKGLEELDLI